jgi:hypothetical protein
MATVDGAGSEDVVGIVAGLRCGSKMFARDARAIAALRFSASYNPEGGTMTATKLREIAEAERLVWHVYTQRDGSVDGEIICRHGAITCVGDRLAVIGGTTIQTFDDEELFGLLVALEPLAHGDEIPAHVIEAVYEYRKPVRGILQ